MRSQTRKAVFLTGTAALAAVVFAGAARADIVFTNFGPGYSFDSGFSYAVTGGTKGETVWAMPFTAGSTADLSDAVLALGNFPFAGNAPITPYLESNNSGQPGIILASLTQQGSIPTIIFGSPGPVTFTYGGANVQLTSGTEYWLVATLGPNADTLDEWYASNSDSGATAANAIGSATGPWSTATNQFISAFQVDGVAPVVVSTVPEPSSAMLLASGLLLALGLLRRKRCGVAAGRN